MILDDDKRVTLKAGDIFVQRGTIHGWHNEGTEWVRMYCVMLRKCIILHSSEQSF